MTNRADSVRVAYPLFHAGGGGSTPTSALDLRFYRTSRETMEALNRRWHSRLPEFNTATPCKAYYAAEYQDIFYATAAWSHPVARMLPQEEWLELRRFAIAPDAPKNTASRMLAWMARDLRRQFPTVVRLISYQDTGYHKGTIYAACGWSPTTIDAGGEWTRPSRFRAKVQSAAPKRRWELEVK